MTERIEIARWSIVALLFLVLLITSISDITDRRIPNWTVLAITILFASKAFVASSVSLVSSLEAAAIVLVVTGTLVAFHAVGAGDSKLMTAASLFVGLSQLPLFVLATVLFGGALAVLSLIKQPTRAFVFTFHMRGRGEFGRGIPYGVAISLACALILMRDLTCAPPIYSSLICF